MPGTVVTKERFDKSEVSKDDVERERKIRIKAGAIRAWIEEGEADWILFTEWNVIGEE